MRFQQLKDLLLYLERVHHQLGRCYGRRMAEVDGERSRMRLAYLHDDLGLLGDGIKETWRERGFSEELLPALQRLSLPAMPRLRT